MEIQAFPPSNLFPNVLAVTFRPILVPKITLLTDGRRKCFQTELQGL